MQNKKERLKLAKKFSKMAAKFENPLLQERAETLLKSAEGGDFNLALHKFYDTYYGRKNWTLKYIGD